MADAILGILSVLSLLVVLFLASMPHGKVHDIPQAQYKPPIVPPKQ